MSYFFEAVQRSVGFPANAPETEEEQQQAVVRPVATAPVEQTKPMVIPALTPRRRRASHPLKSFPAELIMARLSSNKTDIRFIEHFRTLRSRFCEVTRSKGLKSIVLTSALPQEGKSMLAMNLAFSLQSLRGTRVLLVDCDLRRPRVQSSLKLPDGPGIREFLSGDKGFYEVGYEVAPGLDIIPGVISDNASELLQGPRMTQFLTQAKAEYDFILVDSPPLLSVADTEMLISLTDGVLFVVQADLTDCQIAAEAVNRVRSKVIGTVLNDVKKVPKHSAYYYGTAQ